MSSRSLLVNRCVPPPTTGAISKETLFPPSTQNLYGTIICQPSDLLIAAHRAWLDQSHPFGLLRSPVADCPWWGQLLGGGSMCLFPHCLIPVREVMFGRETSLEQQIHHSKEGVTSPHGEPARLRDPRDAQAGETELFNKERRRRRRRYSLLDTTDDSRHTWQRVRHRIGAFCSLRSDCHL